MRSELRALLTLTAAVGLVLAGSTSAKSQDGDSGDPIEPGQVACPDLALARTHTVPVEEDGELLITVRVGNIGDAPSPATSVEVTAPGWENARANVPPLPPPATATLEPSQANVTEVTVRIAIPADQRGKTVEFLLVVDPDMQIDETSSDNNDLGSVPRSHPAHHRRPIWRPRPLFTGQSTPNGCPSGSPSRISEMRPRL